MLAIEASFPVSDYNLAGTLSSGQAFRWTQKSDCWEGVVGAHWVRLRSENNAIVAQVAAPVVNWSWLTHYLQLGVNLPEVLATFPPDPPLQNAIAACHGLRLLRQDPWECLASFICSSTKQIVQIQQIVAALCHRFGQPVPTPKGHAEVFAFPSAHVLAQASEAELRRCKLGFRAPFLLRTAQKVAAGEVDLSQIATLPLEDARAQIAELPGVGPKIADCVLLFAYGFQQAFPVDVWILRVLRELYFPKRKTSLRQLRQFAQNHFGPYAGFAQQYLFHAIRTQYRRVQRSTPRNARSPVVR